MHSTLTVFDSDGNAIDRVDLDAPDAAQHIGRVVLQHYALVDSVPSADEPFITIVRDKPQAAKRARLRKIFPLGIEPAGR